MFGLKRKKQTCLDETKPEKTNEEVTKLYEIPKICGFDLSEETISRLKKAHFDIYNASLGKLVKIDNKPNSGHYCLLNCVHPRNLHEYDIFIYNMIDIKEIPYVDSDNIKEKITSERDIYLFCEYPTNVFNPRPYSGPIIKELIDYSLDRPRITIVFADSYSQFKYKIVEKTTRYPSVLEEKTYDSYSFLPHSLHYSENKIGNKITIATNHPVLSVFFKKYIANSEYRITFSHPTRWNGSKSVPAENFFPLLTNNANVIISYLEINDKNWTIILPNLSQKDEIIYDLLCNILPDLIPDLFPDNDKLAWQYKEAYYLPNEEQLYLEEQEIIKRNEIEIGIIKNKISDNKNKYKYLHSILTDTGDSLVNNIIIYLRWLGFTNIKNMDEILVDTKEEDIQIEIEDGLIIIEAKGIGGTSRDDECSQISKIRSRRCEERKKFDVIALYIVNHQRHIPPLERRNPPFSENQIHDAELEKRGLLTTWDLYNLYFNIENGVISKNKAKECLMKPGLISFMPDKITKLNIVKETYQNGEIVIFDLVENELCLTDKLFYFDGVRYIVLAIISIQVNGKDVKNAINCEVGVKVNRKIKNKTEMFKLSIA